MSYYKKKKKKKTIYRKIRKIIVIGVEKIILTIESS
jgi:hypothetical protein